MVVDASTGGVCIRGAAAAAAARIDPIHLRGSGAATTVNNRGKIGHCQWLRESRGGGGGGVVVRGRSMSCTIVLLLSRVAHKKGREGRSRVCLKLL